MNWKAVDKELPDELLDVLVKQEFTTGLDPHSVYAVAYIDEGKWYPTAEMLYASNDHGYADIALEGAISHWAHIYEE